jgi:hypothetical protein
MRQQPVWFFLVEVEVTGSTKQPWLPGSTALVQCFVPGKRLEESLILLDGALSVEELKRIDTLQAIRYDPDVDDDDLPGEHVREALERAASSNECTLGVFVVSKDTARPISGSW